MPHDETPDNADAAECASCHRDLWWTGLPPAPDGEGWLCAECDAARNFEVLVFGK